MSNIIEIQTTFTSDDKRANIQIAYLKKPIKCHWCNKKTQVISTTLLRINQNAGVCIDCIAKSYFS
jgi:hypothetical protein